jgi:predicted MFS family arabinose efflux permease
VLAALGAWAGGYVFDTFHGYTWLHAGSFAIGLAAVAVALSFPSKRRPSRERRTPLDREE